ncbi:MAG: hypothetical protein ACMUJM_25995 [bacterium]
MKKLGMKYVSIRTSTGTYGFHPVKPTWGNRIWVRGIVKDDSKRKELDCIDTVMTKCASEECVQKKIDSAIINPGPFGSGFYNCHSWVRQIITECVK